jgi:hypothetical protein
MKLSGIIRGYENEIMNTVDIFYSISVTQEPAAVYRVHGICWVDTSHNIPFAFEYNKQNDIVKFKSEYRRCFCSYEVYNKYYLNIRYSDCVSSANFLCVPWLKFQDSGVAVPQLIENIFGYIPNVIVF